MLAHWARNADGQSRMLAAAMRGEVTAQYPGGDAQRAAEIEAGAARPARVILADARAAVSRVEDAWHRMPASAWARLADLAVTRAGRPWTLPRPHPWA